MVVKRARNTAIKVLITGGVIVGVILVAQRFGIGGKVVEGFGGLASTITAAPLEFLKQFALGAGSIGEEAVKVSENFQRALSGGLLASEQKIFGGGGFAGGTVTEETLTTQPGKLIPEFLASAFSVFPAQRTPSTPDRPAGKSAFDIVSAFTREAQEGRISGFQTRTGFSSAQEQEAALQAEIARQRQLNPQFFTLRDS